MSGTAIFPTGHFALADRDAWSYHLAMQTFRDIIGLWPTHRAMAGDIGANHWAVAKWYQRDNIPPEWWNDVISAARRSGHELTAQRMTHIAARRREAA